MKTEVCPCGFPSIRRTQKTTSSASIRNIRNIHRQKKNALFAYTLQTVITISLSAINRKHVCSWVVRTFLWQTPRCFNRYYITDRMTTATVKGEWWQYKNVATAIGLSGQQKKTRLIINFNNVVVPLDCFTWACLEVANRLTITGTPTYQDGIVCLSKYSKGKVAQIKIVLNNSVDNTEPRDTPF